MKRYEKDFFVELRLVIEAKFFVKKTYKIHKKQKRKNFRISFEKGSLQTKTYKITSLQYRSQYFTIKEQIYFKLCL